MDYKAMLSKLLENMRKTDPERLARLEEMGYDTSKVYFHGSPRSDIKEFIPGKTGRDMYGEGVYFTKDPYYADQFASTPDDEIMARNLSENPKFGASESGSYNKEWGNTVYPVFLKKADFSVNDPASSVVKSKFLSTLKSQGQETKTAKSIEDNYNLLNHMREKLYADETSDVLRKSGVSSLELPDEMQLVIGDPQKNIKSIWAKGLAKKGLMTGAVAMDPLRQIGELVNVYRSNQEKVADAVTKQVTQPFGEADEMQKSIMRFALDPLNLVPGAAGVGLGALELMGKRENEYAEIDD